MTTIYETVLDKTLELTLNGDSVFNSSSNVRISGKIKTDGDLCAKMIMIDDTSVVEASNIYCDTIYCNGRVTVKTIKSPNVHLQSSAVVYGNVITSNITIEKGAKLYANVNTDMSNQHSDEGQNK